MDESGHISGNISTSTASDMLVRVSKSRPGGQPYADVTVKFSTPSSEPDVIVAYADSTSEILPHVIGTGNLSHPELREWMLTSNITNTYTHLYSQSIGVPEGDTVWIIERGQWMNNMKQQGSIYTTSSPCWTTDGPTGATWDSTKVTSVTFATS